MLEVELMRNVNFAVDLYREAFRNRYGIEPTIDSGGMDRTIIKDLIRTVGFDEICGCIYLYLKTNDEWYEKCGYSLREFKNKINVIRAAYKKREKASAPLKTVFTNSPLYCDSCWKLFFCVYNPFSKWEETWIKCPSCTKANAPWKYPTEEEFKRNWSALGRITPKYERVFKVKDPYPPFKLLNYTELTAEELEQIKPYYAERELGGDGKWYVKKEPPPQF